MIVIIEGTEEKNIIDTSIKQLLLTLIKGFLDSLRMKKTYIQAFMLALIIWIVHTYMVVFLNEGMGYYYDNKLLYSAMHIGDPYGASGVLAFWFLLAFFIRSSWASFRQIGLKRSIKYLLTFPMYIKMSYACGQNKKSPIFHFMIMLGIIPSLFCNNHLVTLILALIILFSVSKRSHSFLLYFITLFIKDIKLKFSKSKRITLNVGSIVVACFSLSLGLLISTILLTVKNSSWDEFTGYTLLVLLLIAIFLILFVISLINKKNTKLNSNIFIIVFIGLLSVKSNFAFADDGGWTEGGGNFWDWLRSPGALLATLTGWLSSVGGFLGTLFGSAYAAALQNWAFKAIPGTSPIAGPGWLDIMKYVGDIANSNDPNRTAALGIYDMLLPGFGTNVMNPMIDSMLNLGQSDGGAGVDSSSSSNTDSAGYSGGDGYAGTGHSGGYGDSGTTDGDGHSDYGYGDSGSGNNTPAGSSENSGDLNNDGESSDSTGTEMGTGTGTETDTSTETVTDTATGMDTGTGTETDTGTGTGNGSGSGNNGGIPINEDEEEKNIFQKFLDWLKKLWGN